MNLRAQPSPVPVGPAGLLFRLASSQAAPSLSAACAHCWEPSDSSGLSVLAYFTLHFCIRTQLFLCGIFCRKRKLFSHILLQLQKPASTSGNVELRTKPSTSEWTLGMGTVISRAKVIKATFRAVMCRKLGEMRPEVTGPGFLVKVRPFRVGVCVHPLKGQNRMGLEMCFGRAA